MQKASGINIYITSQLERHIPIYTLCFNPSLLYIYSFTFTEGLWAGMWPFDLIL